MCHAVEKMCQHITKSVDGKKHWYVATYTYVPVVILCVYKNFSNTDIVTVHLLSILYK